MTADRRGTPPLELWGGAECTIVRIGDDYRDQTVETGHRDRRDDIDLIADLGIKTVRYPILWEAVAPERPDRLDFGWTDERLAMLRERGIEVIGGLLHHGSGPALHRPARSRISRRSSPIMPRGSRSAIRGSSMWTPVNEPLTTARFSGALRPLVSAPARLSGLPARAGQPVPRHAGGDAGDPRGQSRRAARPDRGSRQDLLDRAAALPGGARE